MNSKPNFFIIGAPKCGTTSLSEYLRSHPQVFFSDPKEPDHFNTDFPGKERLSDEAYVQKYFSGAQQHKAIGEGSTHYLSSAVAVSNILAFNPDAKFIVMLRNPVEMAQSLYFEERSQLSESAPTFEVAWNLQTQRDARTKPSLQYGSIAKVGAQLTRLFAAVPDRSNILLISFDQFVREPAAAYAQVLKFLELEYDGRTVFNNANPRKQPRYRLIEQLLGGMNESPLRQQSAKLKTFLGIAHWPILGTLHEFARKANVKRAPRTALDPAFEAQLYDYFKDDVAIVKNLTGIDLYEKNN